MQLPFRLIVSVLLVLLSFVIDRLKIRFVVRLIANNARVKRVLARIHIGFANYPAERQANRGCRSNKCARRLSAESRA